MRFFYIDKAIQEEGLYVYNMHNIVEKHLISAFYPCEAWAGRYLTTVTYSNKCIL
jgi:hypothetical protein